MKKIEKSLYVSPQVRVAPCSLELALLTVSVNVPGATIGDAEEEEWTVS